MVCTKFTTIGVAGAMLASMAAAEETRELDAHVHGHGALNIAVEGQTFAMELEAPGADIVGFEYEATSDADKSAIQRAIEDLENPMVLFELPEKAGCTVVAAHASLIMDDDDHDDHDDHGHDDHAEDGHDDHGHDDHAEDGHDDHGHDDHAEDGHGDHGHDERAEEASHSEFHAKYTLTCKDPAALDRIVFSYFERFEGAQELEVQVVTAKGAAAFEVERDAPELDLKGLM